MSLMVLRAVALILAAPAITSGAHQIEHVSGAKLDEAVSPTTKGLVVHPVFTDPASGALVVRRTASGEVERHAEMSDIMVARSGKVTILSGGTIEGGRETKVGEWGGGRIVGGTTRSFQAGDMLWIPAGIPHQMILPPGGSFAYIAIKVPRR